jgi:2-oxoglutarate/2-oxoacid ferredoxin oxidoreductase subunit alpha
LLEETFAAKGEEVAGWNRRAAQHGFDMGAAQGHPFSLADIPAAGAPALISGHEALALGALAAGSVYLRLSHDPLEQRPQRRQPTGRALGVVVEQAEDEIAAINMAIGASYAGVRAMTGSSGGGFALMVEALGLAGMQRNPPGHRGVPAPRPQHRPAHPHLPGRPGVSCSTPARGTFPGRCWPPAPRPRDICPGAKALRLAERYQTPVIIFTDQYFGDTN